MKKLFIAALICLVSTSIFAQTDSTKCKFSGYTSVGLSLSTGDDFLASSYPSIETGITHNNLSLGLVLGRGNFVGMAQHDDNIMNYYYEGKITAAVPLGILSGSIVFGYGGYFKTPHMFIEYGAGVSYTKGRFSYGVLCSNWDKIVYITPNITFNY